jgi:hypothetical protein
MATSDLFVLQLCHALKDRLPPAKAQRLEQDLLVLCEDCTPAAVVVAAELGGVHAACWLTLRWLLDARPNETLSAYEMALRPGGKREFRARLTRAAVEALREPLPELSYALARSAVEPLPRGMAGAALSLARAARDQLRLIFKRSGTAATASSPRTAGLEYPIEHAVGLRQRVAQLAVVVNDKI